MEPHTETPVGTLRNHTYFFTFCCISLALGLTACQPAHNPVARLDFEKGVAGFVLGDSLYKHVYDRSAYAAQDHEILEFETFGSRFADDRPVRNAGTSLLYGVRISNVTAGLIDGQVYAYLLQLDADSSHQARLQDSLIAHYGSPAAEVDTVLAGNEVGLAVHQLSWAADHIAMEYGRGDGFAELLVYDRSLRDRRMQVQQGIFKAQAQSNARLSDIITVGDVRLDATRSYAQWRYRYRGRLTPLREGSFGEIDYSYVQPFFEVKGQSLYGLDMAFVNLNFQAGTDSLQTLEVRFENTQGQTVGFMDMLNIMERKLGAHAYSDTLHTKKGPFRRAVWYGDRLAVTLEEHRLRPESRSRSDVTVTFAVERLPIPEEVLQRVFQPVEEEESEVVETE